LTPEGDHGVDRGNEGALGQDPNPVGFGKRVAADFSKLDWAIPPATSEDLTMVWGTPYKNDGAWELETSRVEGKSKYTKINQFSNRVAPSHHNRKHSSNLTAIP
jgi:hypothetical protein